VPQVPRVPRGRWVATLAGILWSAAFSVTALGQAAPAAGKTVNDGVYTSAQAGRGLKIYSASCGICHDTGRFSDDKFFTDWSGKPLQQLFELIATTMPEDNPGGLKPQEYADVVAYLLSVNRFAAGPNELTAGPEGMGGITIVKPASKGHR
jgi:mono/diheme cytochrome c family protein